MKKVFKGIVLILVVTSLTGCESEWQMKTSYTKTYFYNCQGNGRTEKGSNLWIFTGTKKEAESKIKSVSDYYSEPPYCIQSTITTTMVGKK